MPASGARRGLHLVAPLVGLAIVFAFGAAVARDYGLAFDQPEQYRIGHYALDYAFSPHDRPQGLLTRDYRYYGAWFEVALQLPERALGLADPHGVYLGRYILSHLFFLAGGLACYALALRLFGSRALAWFALAFHLGHPRLYAHSFFNSKDTPFLGMFTIGLLLIHRAFDKRTTGAYALLGGWAGLATSIRPAGAVLLALALGGLVLTRGPLVPRFILPRAAAMLAAAAATFYAALPYLWRDPLGHFTEWLALMANHPTVVESLFAGDWVDSRERPLSYLPVWMAITTPLFVLVLAAVGAGVWLRRAAAAPGRLLAHTRLRFEGLLLVAFLGPALVIAAWLGNLYDGWRHAQFLYGPLTLLAAGGLGWLVRHGRRFGAWTFGAVGLGVAGTTGAIALLHPHQQVYFNFLVDRATPEALGKRYEMDYWKVALKQAHHQLLGAYPGGPEGAIPVGRALVWALPALPPRQRERFAASDDFAAFYSLNMQALWREQGRAAGTSAPIVHTGEVYRNTLYAVARLAVAETGPWRPLWADYRAIISTAPAARGRFDVYWDGTTLSHVRVGCRPPDIQERFFLRLSAGDRPPPPAVRRGPQARLGGDGREGWDFWFWHRGVVLRGAGRGESNDVCLARIDLAAHAAKAIRTGQLTADGERAWEVTFASR